MGRHQDRLRLSVICSECRLPRIVSGQTIRHWLRRHHKVSTADYLAGNLCRRCAGHPLVRLSMTCASKKTIECPKCGKTHTVKGTAVWDWLHDHRNKTEADYWKDAPYCHRAMGEWIRQGIPNGFILVTCSQCHETFRRHRITLDYWLRHHPSVTLDELLSSWVCRTCGTTPRPSPKTDAIFGGDIRQSYDLACPQCGIVRRVTPHAIMEWCRSHHKKTVVDYAKEVRCKTCAVHVVTGFTTTTVGYIVRSLPPDSPFFCMTRGANERWRYTRPIFEHRYIMAQMLGRSLTRDEQVHHRDGNPANNSPSNLELRKLNHGNGASLTPTADELLARATALYMELQGVKQQEAELKQA